MITLRPDHTARCWLAIFSGETGFPAGTYPLPFTTLATLPQVAAEMRAKFPGVRVTGVQAVCEGCAS